MNSWVINHVKVAADDGISREEAVQYVEEELSLWKERRKTLCRVEIKLLEDGEVEIKSFEKSPIKRVRRITGYLSTVDRFNDAKRAELADRVTHDEYREVLLSDI